MKKIISSLLSILIVLFCFSFLGCEKEGHSTVDDPYFANAPKYEQNDSSFSRFAYGAPSNGYYFLDGVKYSGKLDENGDNVSFQTYEKFKEYKDCGFDIILFRSNDAYNGEDFDSSNLKLLLDLSEQVGLKAIIYDSRLHNLSQTEGGVVGAEKEYATQDDLNAFVGDCLKDYSKHSAFYGVLLRDEPNYKMFKAIGEVTNAVKAYKDDTFVMCNLYPLSDSFDTMKFYCESPEDAISAYKTYINTYLEETGNDYIMCDSYPMAVSSGKSTLKPLHLAGAQIMAEIAKEQGKEVYLVIQSCSWSNNGIRKTRAITEEDLYWQWYTSLGFGIKKIAYYTYLRREGNQTTGEYFDDGTSFMSSSGELTPVYTWAKNVHEKMDKLNSVISNFEYVGVNYFLSQPTPCSYSFLGGVEQSNFANIENCDVSSSSILMIFEMYDKTKEQYGYLIINACDPYFESTLTANIKFSSSQAVSIYNKGENSQSMLKDGVYSVSLSSGQAVFVLPY